MNILILGMPNVGKTSLYNIISDNDKNIIHNTIGTTRDWHTSPLVINNQINIYDTPGIINTNNSIEKKIIKLINNIDVFLYVIDYKSEHFDNDISLLKLLRKFGKEILLIVNKDDNYKKNKDFNYFGLKNIFFISCSHKLGIQEFLKFLNKYEPIKDNTQKFDFSIGLFGKTNVGKSTLLNKLVGYDRSLVSHKPKTTTDIVSSSFKFKDYQYLIKDTAGLIKKNKIDKDSVDYFATKKTLSIIQDIDINLFLIDINQGFDNQSKKIFNIIYQKSNTLLFLINKIDLINNNKKKILLDLKKDIEQQFSQSKNIYILPISTLYKKDITGLKNFIHKLTADFNKKINTSQINQWLQKTTNKNPHSRIKGKEVKFKYATQISNKPLKIKIFSNYSREISEHYKRFLLNNFYDYFNIKSKNLKIIFSKSNNPYN